MFVRAVKMGVKLSSQQESVVNAPLSPLSVIACAGSGKTKTAVDRLRKVRSELYDNRGYVALLSFSNVAVNTFKYDFSRSHDDAGILHRYSSRIVIETLDSFIAKNVIRPHSWRSMEAKSTPFLLTGSEDFLNNNSYKFWVDPQSGKSYPVQPKDVGDVKIRVEEDGVSFWFQQSGSLNRVNNGYSVMKRLGRVGAYTHDFGKYWACKVLHDEPTLLKAFAVRYPHIIVDEAQDIDAMHSVFLDILASAGVVITLIGDPNQAIYEFSGADGEYLKEFDAGDDCNSLRLSKNYRSIEDIVKISNRLSGSHDSHHRAKADEGFGAYFCFYDNGDENNLVDTFVTQVESGGLSLASSAVLVRGRKKAEAISGIKPDIGKGKTKLLALATIKRDIDKDYHSAYRLVVNCVSGLLNGTPDDFIENLSKNNSDSEYRKLRQKIWHFLRCDETGLPSASLKAKSEWHPILKSRIEILLKNICRNSQYKPVDRLGNKLASTGLSDEPFSHSFGLKLDEKKSIRIDTVHQSKGETLGAVMYIATHDHARKMLDGTNTEVGRIGYVALTRARDLFLLAIPRSSKKKLEPELLGLGFKFLE